MKVKHKHTQKHQPVQYEIAGGNIHEVWGKKWKNLFAPVDISSLVFFRVLFGLIMFYEVFRYFDHGWISRYWIEPKYHFTYWPFDFITPLPGDALYVLFSCLAILALFIAVGFLYRISVFLFFVGFTYTFLLEQTRYLNHFYLVILITCILNFLPLHTSGSVDSKIFKNLKSETIPAWSLWLMRFMIALPYFFGGIAKINSDWLQGQPLSIWLLEDTSFPLIGPLFKYHSMILFMSYSGLLLDLLIIPGLLYKKTRKWAFLFGSAFHLMNSELFDIGIFPWFMVAATCLFFEPNWFRKGINYVSGNSWPLKFENQINNYTAPLSGRQRITVTLLSVWVMLHLLLPLRHLFIPGSVHWTEEGHKFAWHMKLRTKKAEGIYTAVDKVTGQKYVINPLNYLQKRQLNQVNDTPDMIWQFCQFIKKDFKKVGVNVAVYADIKASLNGRKEQQLIYPDIDITTLQRPYIPVKWIVPLTTPLSE